MAYTFFEMRNQGSGPVQNAFYILEFSVLKFS